LTMVTLKRSFLEKSNVKSLFFVDGYITLW